MGDLSHLIPPSSLYSGGIRGLVHAADLKVADYEGRGNPTGQGNGHDGDRPSSTEEPRKPGGSFAKLNRR